MSLRYLSINQLYELTGIDRATIKKRLVDLKPHSEDKRAIIYDAREAIPILLGDKKEKDSMSKKILEENLKYEQARRKKIELENQKALGEVVEITTVAKTVAAEYTNVRSRILSIPSRCAMDLSLETNPSLVKDRLDQEIHEALAELTADSIYEENYENGEQLNDITSVDETEDTQGTAET